MEKFHIWNLERINIRLKNSFLEKINEKINEQFKSKYEAYNFIFNKEGSFFTFKNILKPSYNHTFFVPLDFFQKIVEVLGFTKEELEQNIVSYKTAGGVNCIENPNLPIRINPVFDMLLAHHIGDGTVINPKKGRLPYFGYRQFDKFYRISYIKKLEFIFGKINFKENYFENSTRPYCPASVSSLFFRYYKLKIEDFHSHKARIPSEVYNNWESMLAFLVGMIIDEGYVDSTQIVITQKNKMLIEDLKNICRILNYPANVTLAKSEEKKEYWRLRIQRKGMENFWKDYLCLNNTYPLIDLGKKGVRIKNSFEISERPVKRTKGNQVTILGYLKKEQLSVNQIAERIKMTRQGVRYHIHKLIKSNKIQIIDKSKLNWIYCAK